MGYDVIIAGASFAGLAVASQLRGKLLLIEPNPIGAHQTSACATPLWVAEQLGLMDSVLRVHRRLVIHTRSSRSVVNLSEHPYCTFDYEKFCRGMAATVQADFLRAHVLSREGNRIVTTRGLFAGEVLVDASGWRAVLVRREGGFLARRGSMSFGVETVAPKTGDELGFWFDPGVLPQGFGWDFPVEEGSRIGLASYEGKRHLRKPLEAFLGRWGLARAETHGGYFTAALQDPVQEDLFLVGDAAGQCLPVTGEGIRPAIYFGLVCGGIIQKILDGQLTREEGRRVYRDFVMTHRRLYGALRIAQSLGVALPAVVVASLLWLACKKISLSFILPLYTAFASSMPLRL